LISREFIRASTGRVAIGGRAGKSVLVALDAINLRKAENNLAGEEK
jgi:hypothetical protein